MDQNNNFPSPTGNPSQDSHFYNYPQGNLYNNTYYTGYNNTLITNTNNASYPSYYSTPESTVQGQASSTSASNTPASANAANNSDPSQIPHFWDDCEYVTYTQGADSCSMCSEEMEDDSELIDHLRTQHHVVFFACTTCRNVHDSLDTLRSHECKPFTISEPTIEGIPSTLDKKRKRGPTPSTKPITIPEKVKLNEFGAVYIPPQKRARQKPTRGTAQIQDMLQWQQSYNSTTMSMKQEETSRELVVRDEEAINTLPLTRELLLEAKQSTDGLPVDVDRMPASAIMCRTCNLLFASSYQLNRHAGFSKTHKKNVDIQRRQEQKAIRFDVTGDSSQKATPLEDSDTYRDRSAERRAENPEGCPLDYQPYDTVTDYVSSNTPIEASNVGRKLLESMGWKEGKGLGKNEIGIVNPIIPSKTFRGAGLGIEINPHEVAANEASTYSDYLRNKKLARYAELEKTIRDPVG